MHLDAEEGDKEITELLLTALRIATESGSLQIVTHFLKHGADVNSVYTSTTQHGYTLLCLAIEKDDEQTTELLF